MKSVESQYIQDYHYDETDSLLRAISYKGELFNLLSGDFIFRGHFSDDYQLLPFALREGSLDRFYSSRDYLNKAIFTASQLEVVQMMTEYELLQRFYNICDKNHLRVPDCPRLRDNIVKGYDLVSLFGREDWLPREFWEVAALAQHYGIPTRLLDWTSNIHTALYFAIKDYIRPVSMRERVLKQKDFLLNESKVKEPLCEIWALDTKVVVAKEGKLPLILIRPPYHGNPNLAAQEGVFTLWTVTKPVSIKGGKYTFDKNFKDRKPLDYHLSNKLDELKADAHPYLYRITFPQRCCAEIYGYLKRIGNVAAKLFPGYNGVTQAMREDAAFADKASK